MLRNATGATGGDVAVEQNRIGHGTEIKCLTGTLGFARLEFENARRCTARPCARPHLLGTARTKRGCQRARSQWCNGRQDAQPADKFFGITQEPR